MSLIADITLHDLAVLLHQGTRRCVVTSHVRPDGDAIGSALALAFALERLGHTVVVLNEDGMPDNLRFLPGSDRVVRPSGPLEADIVFALDNATQPRLGEAVNAAIADVPQLVNVDHHISNTRYGHHHYIDPTAPATGQIIAEWLEMARVPIEADIAENLYTAISTDTGSFQYSNTTPATYRWAARLIEAGLNVGELNRKIYQSSPLRRIRLLGELLQVLDISSDGRVASWHLTLDMMARAGARPEDSENMIDHIRGIDGVVVAAFFEELADGKVRLSLRSKDVRFDASALCAQFGGGGHKMAAGARMRGPIGEARSRVLISIHEALNAAIPA
ncbi:MAG: DHH family phosphoesterase [Verrucomicrobiales bacterium]